VGNWGIVRATAEPRLGKPYSLVLTLPPLAAVFLKWVPSPPADVLPE
jgi:hypothetical protein